MIDWNTELASVIVRGSLLLLVTFLVAAACRRCSAAVIYRVWFLGFCSCLLAPNVPFLVPKWNLNVLPNVPSRDSSGYSIASESVQSEIGDAPQKVLEPKPGSPFRFSGIDVNEPEAIAEPRHGKSASASGSVSSKLVEGTPSFPVRPITGTRTFSIFDYFLLFCLAGFSAIVLRLIIQYLAILQTMRQCERFEDANALRILNESSEQLQIATPVLLSHPTAVTPFLTGFWKPKIILPEMASSWTEPKLKLVLLHELAHAKRRDILNQAIAKFVTAIHWCNPLAWWGYSEMLKWREIACDDIVIGHAGQPAYYADTLLEFANEYRCFEQQFVVGMAHTHGVTQRILAILDSSRSRGVFSKRASRTTACIAVGMCLIAGTLQLGMQADEAQESKPLAQPTAQPQENSDAKAEQKKGDEKAAVIDEEARSMLVRILDEHSNPIVGADVFVDGIDLGRRGNLPGNHFPTDSAGEAKIRFRDGKLALRLWSSKPGYVPQKVNMDEKELAALPSQYTFYLEKGSRLAGKVVDVSGSPIAGAKVQVVTGGIVELSELSKQTSPIAICNGRLAEDKAAAITNDNGEWETFSAPSGTRNPKLAFVLFVDHPDFTSDLEWGQYQTKQRITTEQLRNGTALLVMDKGAILRGKIIGPDGEPVTKGLVIWVSNPYNATGVNETEINQDGSFRLTALQPGTYPITVLVPGYAPTLRKVEISQGSPACDFQLEAGNPIRIEIVDTSGKPIPKVSVYISSWRKTAAIYNDKSTNIPDSGIARYADEHGVFSWDWAPNDGVEYKIHAAGYTDKTLTLIAKPEAHRIVLSSALTISGNVVDAITSSPIPAFKVIPVQAFSPDFYSTDFQKSRVALGQNGKYVIRIDSSGGSTNRHRVRIEADGYRTAFGKKSRAAGEPPLVEDFELEPALPLVGTVVTNDGQPVNKFQVAIGTATTSPRFRLDRPDNLFGQAFEIEGKNTFKIAATFEAQRIRVFNDIGFTEFVVQPEQREIGQVVLAPFAKLSGRLLQNDQPVAAQGIIFHPFEKRGPTEARFQDSFSTQTDSNGNFSFELPPMTGSVRAYLGPWEDSKLTSSQSVPLELKSGQHQQLALGSGGVQITGRVVATGRDDAAFTKKWSLNWLVSREPSVNLPSDAPPFSISAKEGALEPGWLKHIDFHEWLATKANYFAKLRDDGYLSIHGVPAGEYDLLIQLFEQPAGCLVEAIGTKIVPVTITKELVANGQFDIGAIEIPCRVGPRPGSYMHAYQFANAEGEMVHVNDMNGRYVLFHVWASWCQPCLVSMPKIQACLQELADSPITAVGLNIDAEKKRGETLAKNSNWNWAQNYLGEDSDLARQLAVSSVPAYYLIGPDGNLIGVYNEWIQIEELLKAKIKH